ncbi:MAG TPA: MBL fold metallo-hydrolase [Chloroflexota bacterium]|nr:MBL fold metallo-hydrolase [Chloroflexota bacterium]
MCDPHIEHVDEYLALAEAAGAGIGHVFETHVQADHVSGALELAGRAGARIYLHEAADVAFRHADVRDGDEIQLGNDYLRVLHTPGHSEDSVCYLVGDRTRGPDPWFVLTGDTLFVGSAGRPDLHGEEASRRLAGQLHDSLGKLLALPDDLEVYPAHFAGSACGKAMSGKPSSTIGFERRFNEALRPRARSAFVAFMTTDLPPQPPEFAGIRRRNQGLPVPAR